MACRTNATDWMTGGARNRHRRHERTVQRVPDRNRDVVREERLLAVGASLLLSTVLEIGDHLANSPNGRRPGRLRAAAAHRPEPSPSPTTLGLKLKFRTVCEVLLRGRCSCLTQLLRSEGSILSGEISGLDRRRHPLRRGFARPVTGRFAPENPGQGNESCLLGLWMALWLSWRA